MTPALANQAAAGFSAVEEQTASIDPNADDAALRFLRKSVALYERLVAYVERLEKRGDDEKTLKWLVLAAEVAWRAHPGRLSDGRLEAVALRAGRRLGSQTHEGAAQKPAPGRALRRQRRILHVATTVYETGGHTRLIENWVSNDGSAHHSLIVLDQQGYAFRSRLGDAIAASEGRLIILPDGLPILECAAHLRAEARAGYDLVILHTHPGDAVPLVALATDDCPPVALMNHADHVFWLGVSVADAVINFRYFGAQLSVDRRGAATCLLLPLPIAISSPRTGRSAARERLGIAADEVVLLTIAAGYKIRPSARHDFFRAAHRILESNPSSVLYIIGADDQDRRNFGAIGHERLRMLGTMSDPGDYLAAADLYLESFPFGSYTALIEAASGGVCPVLMPSPTAHNDLSKDIPFLGLLPASSDEGAHLALVSELAKDPGRRSGIGEAVASQVLAYHGTKGWLRHLGTVYDALEGRPHRPAALADSPSSEGEHDLDLARFIGTEMTTPAVEYISERTLSRLGAKDLLRLFRMSRQTGDTRLTPAHLKAWLSMLKRKVRPTAA